jgi:hypothetical protein
MEHNICIGRQKREMEARLVDLIRMTTDGTFLPDRERVTSLVLQ